MFEIIVFAILYVVGAIITFYLMTVVQQDEHRSRRNGTYRTRSVDIDSLIGSIFIAVLWPVVTVIVVILGPPIFLVVIIGYLIARILKFLFGDFFRIIFLLGIREMSVNDLTRSLKGKYWTMRSRLAKDES